MAEPEDLTESMLDYGKPEMVERIANGAGASLAVVRLMAEVALGRVQLGTAHWCDECDGDGDGEELVERGPGGELVAHCSGCFGTGLKHLECGPCGGRGSLIGGLEPICSVCCGRGMSPSALLVGKGGEDG